MLRTAETDTHCAEVACHLRVVRRVRIRAHHEFRILIAEIHQFGEITRHFCRTRLHLTEIHLARRTIDGDIVTLVEQRALDLHRARLVVHLDGTGATHAALTHTTCHDSSVRRHTATRREDTLCRAHTSQVLRTRLNTYHHHTVALLVPFRGIVSEEDDLTAGSTRRSRQTTRQHLGTCQSLLVEDRVEQFVQLARLATLQRRLLVDLALVEQVHGDLHHGRTRALTVARLQEPEFSLLYGKLHVLHVVVVLLQLVLQRVELLEDLRHVLLH